MTTFTMLLGVLALIYGIWAAPISQCPQQCSCTGRENSLELSCRSFDFLKDSELSSEQIKSIVSITINNGPATKMIPNLHHLLNLKHLSLTSMKIQQIIAARLPKWLEYLDLSQNLIAHLPQDLHILRALKEVNFSGNPMSCNCESLGVRDALLEKGVSIVKPVKCESPADVRGKMWLSVACKNENIDNLFGEMQGDAPYEGSGSGEIPLVADIENTENVDQGDTIEEGYMPISTSSNLKVAPEQELPTEEKATEKLNVAMEEQEPAADEGSGDGSEITTPAIEETPEVTTVAVDYDEDTDEDLDDYTDGPPITEPPVVSTNMSLLEQSRVKACNFNCSTPAPLPANETDVSPPPGFFEGLKMVASDLGIINHPENITTTTTAALTEPPTTLPSVVPEEPIEKKTKTLLDTSLETEVFKNDTKNETEKANIEEPKQSHSTFIFLSVLLLVIICLVIYAIVKKRSLNRNRHIPSYEPEEKEKMLEELELIKMAPENEKTINGTHESVPLMNGHNENQNKNDEEVIPDTNDAPDNEGEDDVELRSKKEEQKNLLTPEAKRVTIKASEIPNSTPKTPILVTRHVNSDGSIVTTPTVDQDV